METILAKWGPIKLLSLFFLITAGTAIAGVGDIEAVAGTGTAGYNGDNISATSARLNEPIGIAVSSNGDVYIADRSNFRVRRVKVASGTIETYAGTGTQGFGGDGGAATSANLDWPLDLAFDSSGNLYIADFNNNRVRKVDRATLNITTYAGNGSASGAANNGDGGLATSANVVPMRLDFDSNDNLYIAETSRNRIRKVDTDGNISTVAGSMAGTGGFSGDGGSASSALLSSPRVTVDNDDNLIIGDTGNYRIRKIGADGNINTIAGTGNNAFSGDNGLATVADLHGPESVVVDSFNNIIFSDTNHRIRKIDHHTGVIYAIAGTGETGDSGDGGPALVAKINRPQIGIDSSNNLYLSSQQNDRVRKITGTPADSVATLSSPGNNTMLAGSTVTFSWTGPTSPSMYWLYIGNSFSSWDILSKGVSAAESSYTVDGLPTDGRTIYLQLWVFVGGNWHSTHYSFTAADDTGSGGTGGKAQLTSHRFGDGNDVDDGVDTDGFEDDDFGGVSETFKWDNPAASRNFWITVGNEEGGRGVFDRSVVKTSTDSNFLNSITINNLPIDGRNLFLRLWSQVGGEWKYTDYQFKAVDSGSGTATLDSPAVDGNGVGIANLTSSSQTFEWTVPTGVSQVWISIGNSQGSRDIYSQSQGTATSSTIFVLPTDGRTIYLRLWSRVFGNWEFEDYRFTAASLGTGIATLDTPAVDGNGDGVSALSGSSQTFEWTVPLLVSQVWIFIGNSEGGRDIYNQSQGTGSSVEITGLPSDGRTLYFRLWSRVSGRWEHVDYRFTAASLGAGTATLDSPAVDGNGDGVSSLGVSSQTFTWTVPTRVSQVWIYIGNSEGGREIYNRSHGTGTSASITGLPTDGRTLYLRLWSLVSGRWEFEDYRFTAHDSGVSAIAALTSHRFGDGNDIDDGIDGDGFEDDDFGSASETFAWNRPDGVSTFWIYLGTTPGGWQLRSQRVTDTMVTLNDLPTDGRTVYFRLWTNASGAWKFNDYVFTASNL